MEKIIYNALTDKEITHEDFATIKNEERNHRELKENIRSDKEINKLIEDCKRMGINKIIKQNDKMKKLIRMQNIKYKYFIDIL